MKSFNPGYNIKQELLKSNEQWPYFLLPNSKDKKKFAVLYLDPLKYVCHNYALSQLTNTLKKRKNQSIRYPFEKGLETSKTLSTDATPLSAEKQPFSYALPDNWMSKGVADIRGILSRLSPDAKSHWSELQDELQVDVNEGSVWASPSLTTVKTSSASAFENSSGISSTSHKDKNLSSTSVSISEEGQNVDKARRHDNELKPILSDLPPSVKAPKSIVVANDIPYWHKFKLTKRLKAKTSETGIKTGWKEASDVVMSDIIKRKKHTTADEMRRAEENMQKRRDRMNTQRAKAEAKADELNQRQQEAMSQRRASRWYNEMQDSTAKDSDNEIEDKFEENGIKPERKLYLLKEYLRMKKWLSTDNEKVKRIRELVEHWSKICQRQVTDNTTDTYAWTDEWEKAFFSDLHKFVTEKHKELQFDPYVVLHTAYLRLQTESVKWLEQLCRENGKDPGIHYHAPPDSTVHLLESNANSIPSLPKTTNSPTSPKNVNSPASHGARQSVDKINVKQLPGQSDQSNSTHRGKRPSIAVLA